jgi:hypothetical protein
MVMFNVAVGKFENLCPVCGFEMDEPPIHYNICPCCGTEFGVNDVNAPISKLRLTWIGDGMKWWSNVDPIPEQWNPFAQLARVSGEGVLVVSASSIDREITQRLAWTSHGDKQSALEYR